MKLLLRTAAGTLLAVVAVLAVAAPASAAANPQGGCAAFGANVAGLAGSLGPLFGATASSVATSGPRQFPTLVVHPEQEALCHPQP